MDLIYSGGLYFITWSISLFVIKRKYYKSLYNQAKPKITTLSMIAISMLFTLYNVFITRINPNLGSDRFNYSVEFSGARSVSSIGLQFIFDVVNKSNGDIYAVFYITTFISVLITLYAYRKSKVITPQVFGLLMFSDWFFYTVTALKQSYVNAIAVLFFVYLFEDEQEKKTIKCMALALLASVFHITGIVLIIILVLVKIKKAEKIQGLLYIALLAAVLLLNPLLQIGANLLLGINPAYAMKILSYLSEGRRAGDGSSWGVIKYIPIYFTMILGFNNRRRLKDKLLNYDYYLVVTVLATGLLLCSARIYWFLRFVGVFYVPVYTFFVKINKSIYESRTRRINYIVMYGACAFFFIRWFVLIYSNYGGF